MDRRGFLIYMAALGTGSVLEGCFPGKAYPIREEIDDTEPGRDRFKKLRRSKLHGPVSCPPAYAFVP